MTRIKLPCHFYSVFFDKSSWKLWHRGNADQNCSVVLRKAKFSASTTPMRLWLSKRSFAIPTTSWDAGIPSSAFYAKCPWGDPMVGHLGRVDSSVWCSQQCICRPFLTCDLSIVISASDHITYVPGLCADQVFILMPRFVLQGWTWVGFSG